MVKTASLYDNFCKTGNYVIYDVIIWVPRWKLQKMAWENFSIAALYNITKNQDNAIKTVGRDSFLSPKTPKNTSFLGSPSPQGSHSPYILGDTTRPRHITYVLVWWKSHQRRLRKTLHKQTDRHYKNNGHLAVNQFCKPWAICPCGMFIFRNFQFLGLEGSTDTTDIFSLLKPNQWLAMGA